MERKVSFIRDLVILSRDIRNSIEFLIISDISNSIQWYQEIELEISENQIKRYQKIQSVISENRINDIRNSN